MPTSENHSNVFIQLRSFIGVGIFTALIDWGTTMTLTALGLQREVAKIPGWVLGTLAAYLLNSRYTFKTKVTAGKAAAVFVLYASTFGIQWFLFWITNAPLEAIGLSGMVKDTVAFIIAQGAATITNFILQRTVVFRERKSPRVVVQEEPRRAEER